VEGGSGSPDPFDGLAAGYESWYATPLGAFVIAREEEALLSAIDDERPASIVDVGAGTGWWSRVLAGRGWRVTAVEPSEAMAGIGRDRCRGLAVEWIEASAARLPLADATHDGALLFTVLEFVTDPGAALREAWRVVRPGGLVLVAHLEPRSPWAEMYRAAAEQGRQPWTAARFFAGHDLEHWLGSPPEYGRSCAWLGPDAQPPFDAADERCRRAGGAPALTVLKWRKKR
jgi:ubiquinone/menaquinone biosynthesis C-methylase UbiE